MGHPAASLSPFRKERERMRHPQLVPGEMLELPVLAQKHSLTNYDAAYLALATCLNLPLATTDADLRKAAAAAGVAMVAG